MDKKEELKIRVKALELTESSHVFVTVPRSFEKPDIQDIYKHLKEDLPCPFMIIPNDIYISAGLSNKQLACYLESIITSHDFIINYVENNLRERNINDSEIIYIIRPLLNWKAYISEHIKTLKGSQ